MKKLLPKTWPTRFLHYLFILFFSGSFFGIVGISSVNADTIFQQSDFSVQGTTTIASEYPRAVLNDNSAVGIGGTIQYITFYTTTPTTWISFLTLNPASSWSGLFFCSSAYDSSAGLGCYRDSRVFKDTYSISGNYITFELDSPMTMLSTDFLAINLARFTGVETSGTDPSSCWITNIFSGVYGSGQCSATGGMGIGAPFVILSGSLGFTPPPIDTSTHIISIDPAQNAVASSSPTISGTFYNQSELYNQLIIDLSWVEPSVNTDLLLSGLAHRQFIFDIGTSTSNQSFSTTTDDLLTGRWLLSTQFSESTDAFGYFTATTTSFIVGTTTTFYSDYVQYATTTATTTAGAPISSCTEASNVLEKALCALGDRIKDVLQFLFVPDATVLNQFGTLKENITSRIPFGYFPLFKNALSGVSASSTAIFSLVIPVSQIPRFGSVRTGLGWVFLFWFVVHMWRRFKHIQI